MEVYNFEDVVDVTKFSNCAVCNTFVYTMPCQIDVDFGDYLVGSGRLEYPLDKCKIVRLDNEYMMLTSRVGRNWLEVKFKKSVDERRPIFDTNIAAYVEVKQNITIKL